MDATRYDNSPWRHRFAHLHRTIRERITLLAYPPGTRLNLDELAAEFDVSRTPLRNVLQRLEREGLLETRHGVGTTVTTIRFDSLREATLLRMHLAELIGVLNPVPPDRGIVEEMRRLADLAANFPANFDFEHFARIDMGTHACIAGLIGNELLSRFYDELFFRTARMWFYFLPKLDWPTETRAIHQHVDLVLGAMERRDPKAVGQITRNAISSGLYRLDDILTEAEVA